MPEFLCDLSQPAQKLDHFWEHTVGSGNALLALRSDWQEQLLRACHELGFRYVRFHNLFSDRMSTLTCQQGELLYSFLNIDRIFDYLLEIGMKPFVELSFMPQVLASGNRTVFSYAANVTPPKDPKQWAALIDKIMRHWIERYGLEEVRQWMFEVWNEPNEKSFWAGSQRDYFRFYKTTAETIKEVDEGLKVGGPATSKNAWIEAFLDYCNDRKVPVDFISTHHYPTDAFGTIGQDTNAQLAAARRSILREQTQDARRRANGFPLFYTEWNASSNPRDALHDQSYSAAFAAKTILENRGLVEAYSIWTFSDIFEENYFPSVPFHGGFGLLNLHGIPKPVYRAYQMLHAVGNEMYLVDGMHQTVDTWVTRKNGSVHVLLTNHALPTHPIDTERVQVRLSSIPRPNQVEIQRIDDVHANPRRRWQEMGEPEYLNTSLIERLSAASALKVEALPVKYEKGIVEFQLKLPAQSVCLVTLHLSHEGKKEKA